MFTRRIGRSDVEVGELGLGTWALSGESYGPVDAATARDILRAHIDEGGTLIDTAPAYGDEGAVEKLVGEVLAERGRRMGVVCTRLGVLRTGDGGARKLFTPTALRAGLEASLLRLRTDFIDVALLHNPRPETLRAGDAFGALQRAKEQGKTRLIGVSVATAEAARAALALPLDVLALPYNVLYARLLHGLAAEVSAAGVGVFALAPLAYGVLSGRWSEERELRDDDHRRARWSREELAARLRQREAARVLVQPPARSLLQASLRFVLANKLVSAAVVGARTPPQARENAHAADELPYLDDEAFAQLGERMAREGVAV